MEIGKTGDLVIRSNEPQFDAILFLGEQVYSDDKNEILSDHIDDQIREYLSILDLVGIEPEQPTEYRDKLFSEIINGEEIPGEDLRKLIDAAQELYEEFEGVSFIDLLKIYLQISRVRDAAVALTIPERFFVGLQRAALNAVRNNLENEVVDKRIASSIAAILLPSVLRIKYGREI